MSNYIQSNTTYTIRFRYKNDSLILTTQSGVADHIMLVGKRSSDCRHQVNYIETLQRSIISSKHVVTEERKSQKRLYHNWTSQVFLF